MLEQFKSTLSPYQHLYIHKKQAVQPTHTHTHTRTHTIQTGVHIQTGLREQLKTKIDTYLTDSAAAESKLREIIPYYSILQRALAAGAGTSASDAVEQSGFQQLYEIEQGGSPTCCVCQVCACDAHTHTHTYWKAAQKAP